MTNDEIVEYLRRRITADVHLGRLRPGSRLPSLRIVAREIGASIRAVAHAYNDLEREGLVNVRGRSGIYLVLPPSIEPELPEPLDWYAEMLKDAWQRRIPLKDLSEKLQQIVDNPLRAACVESTEDTMIAFCSELEEDFALDTISVKLTPEGARVRDQVMTLPDALADSDFAVTTAFHATEVRQAADQLGIPTIIVSMNDTLVEALQKELEKHSVTMVADDPAFVARMRECFIDRFEASGKLNVIAMADLNGNAELAGSTPMYTRAARKRMKDADTKELAPPVAFVSETAARKIVQYMFSMHAKRAHR
jgi:DNA-binding transcriptional regulator YhcF (GntR family)